MSTVSAPPKSDIASLSAKLSAALAGTRLTEISHSEFDWLFSFGPSWNVRTQSYWRLIANGGIAISGDDDGQWFGLPKPVDAAERVKALATEPLTAVEVNETTADLRMHFGSAILEFLNTSSGYEGWQLTANHQQLCGFLVSLGGGGVSGTL